MLSCFEESDLPSLRPSDRAPVPSSTAKSITIRVETWPSRIVDVDEILMFGIELTFSSPVRSRSSSFSSTVKPLPKDVTNPPTSFSACRRQTTHIQQESPPRMTNSTMAQDLMTGRWSSSATHVDHAVPPADAASTISVQLLKASAFLTTWQATQMQQQQQQPKK